MAGLPLGVLIDSFRVPAREGIDLAARLGFEGIQMYVTSGEVAPEQLDGSGRADLRRLLERRRLELAAACGELGGFADANRNDEIVERTLKMIDLCVDLGVRALTTHFGRVPESPDDPVRETIRQAVEIIGAYAANRDCCLAAETGGESPETLRGFIEQLDCDGVMVNYDPANLVCRGHDPVAGVGVLHPWIVHTHAKDGVREKNGHGREVPLGQGDVDWPAYVAALAAIEYHGFYTIEREAGDDPVADIAAGKAFLEQL